MNHDLLGCEIAMTADIRCVHNSVKMAKELAIFYIQLYLLCTASAWFGRSYYDPKTRSAAQSLQSGRTDANKTIFVLINSSA